MNEKSAREERRKKKKNTYSTSLEVGCCIRPFQADEAVCQPGISSRILKMSCSLL